ncbi:uncharacterized protein STEHIDRAFT_69556, partial [Stereum hirsutum FP-91666 SS1]
MISRCRAKSWIIQMNEDKDKKTSAEHTQEHQDSRSKFGRQHGMKGHVIIYPQRPERVASRLPPSLDELGANICVLFVGSKPPTQEWLKAKAKPLIARAHKVRAALLWLKQWNPFYHDIDIDEDVLGTLSNDHAGDIVPVHIETVSPKDVNDNLTSRYDNINFANNIDGDGDIPFQSIVVTNVDQHSTANELRTAALRHLKKGSSYLSVAHDMKPVNEWFNPGLFPMIYPTLYPYGIGGFEEDSRVSRLSFHRHVRHL